MTFALLTNILSPHQLPLANAIRMRIGKENYSYFYTQELPADRKAMGWPDFSKESWCHQIDESDRRLPEVDVLLAGNRAVDVFERRNALGKKTFFAFERWFRPPFGFARLLHPGFFRMARRFVVCTKSPYFILLPQGVHAARDMARLIGLFSGDWRCLFRAPSVTFEPRPGGRLTIDGRLAERFFMWAYFVEPSRAPRRASVLAADCVNVMWAGRLLELKRADTVIRACRNRKGLRLSVYGNGPDEKRLRRLADRADNIVFHDFLPPDELRRRLRRADVLVLSSDGREGWGAIVNEALAEGVSVLGTYEADAARTLLPETNLFHAGDEKRLCRLLSEPVSSVPLEPWVPAQAADALLTLMRDV